MTRAAAVVLAGGAGTRVGSPHNKVLLEAGGEPLLVHSIRAVLEVTSVHRVVVVCRSQDRDLVSEVLAPHLGSHVVWLVGGGERRHDSEDNALRALTPDIEAGELDVVAIHDAARPLAEAALWERVIESAAENGGAIPVIPAGRLSCWDGSLAPQGLVAVQTPQAFRAAALLDAYDRARDSGFRGTDTAACLAEYADPALRIVAVPSSPTNLKVTFPQDLVVADSLLRRRR